MLSVDIVKVFIVLWSYHMQLAKLREAGFVTGLIQSQEEKTYRFTIQELGLYDGWF